MRDKPTKLAKPPLLGYIEITKHGQNKKIWTGNVFKEIDYRCKYELVSKLNTVFSEAYVSIFEM